MAPSNTVRESDAEQREDPNEAEIAWSDEVRRRVEKVREGTAETVSEAEFFQRLRSAQ